MSPNSRRHRTTRLLHRGRAGFGENGLAPVNQPPVRASTIRATDLETFERESPYATKGTDTTRALGAALREVEGGDACHLCPSGLAAIAVALTALTRSGDHILVSDALYFPTRRLLNTLLKDYGVSTTYFGPHATTDEIAAMMRDDTAVVFLESPGSDTLEVLDVPAIAAAARQRGAVTMIDNTWSAGWLFDPFAAGCAVSIQAATKYQAGHGDVLLGAVLSTDEVADRIAHAHLSLGQCPGSEEAWLTLRGLRTMPLRLQRQGEGALKIAHWLTERDEVAAVLHPALPGHPGHEIFQRDFTGASGLFSFVLKPEYDDAATRRMLDGLELFGLGASWGGYESLVMRKRVREIRSVSDWPHDGWLIRLSIGLEEPDDLMADLQAGLERL